jgi:hypothetical protein
VVYRAVGGWLLIMSALVLVLPAVVGIRRSFSLRTRQGTGEAV